MEIAGLEGLLRDGKLLAGQRVAPLLQPPRVQQRKLREELPLAVRARAGAACHALWTYLLTSNNPFKFCYYIIAEISKYCNDKLLPDNIKFRKHI